MRGSLQALKLLAGLNLGIARFVHLTCVSATKYVEARRFSQPLAKELDIFTLANGRHLRYAVSGRRLVPTPRGQNLTGG